MSKRVSFKVLGRVQGVCFRQWTTETANGLNITGFVKNHEDGSVIGEAQGDSSSIDRLIQRLHIGPSAAKVSRVDHNDIDIKDNEAKFEQIRH